MWISHTTNILIISANQNATCHLRLQFAMWTPDKVHYFPLIYIYARAGRSYSFGDFSLSHSYVIINNLILIYN